MSTFDRDYLALCQEILTRGVREVNRTGVDTLKLPSWTFHFDLQVEFPILTTKQVFLRQAVLEILWIYQVQSNDVRWLQERNVHIWDEWAIGEDGLYHAPVLRKQADGSYRHDTVVKDFGVANAFTIGTAYGWIVREYRLFHRLLETLQTAPTDRRMVVSLWQDAHLATAVLPSCVWSTEWDVTDGYLNLWVHQRSCDVALGLPFNVSQYAVLLSMVAQVCGLKPGKIDWSIKNPHLYVNQIEGIEEQLRRYRELGDFPAPQLWLNPEVDDFFAFDHSKELLDVRLENYQHHGKITFQVAK